MAKGITVIKASGEREPFSQEKVRQSIRRAGIPEKLAGQVVTHVREILYDGIPTYELYKHITEYISKSDTPYVRGRYALKQAIMELGPSGFPFEKFVARVLEHHGYRTQTGVIVSGKCVDHEVDVVAEKNGHHFMLECKFHNRPGARSDVKVALYVQARFEDVAKTWEQPGNRAFDQAWLVTNTKFTSEAITYGNCVGMKVIGWSHPESGDLQTLIEDAGLHPITCMTTLTEDQKRQLLVLNVVLCKQIVEDTSALESLGIPEGEYHKIHTEAMTICQHKNIGNH